MYLQFLNQRVLNCLHQIEEIKLINSIEAKQIVS